MRREEEYVSHEEIRESLLRGDPSLSINTDYMTVLIRKETVRIVEKIWNAAFKVTK